MQGRVGKYSERVKRIHVRRVGQAEGEMKGTRTGKVMEREKRMEEGDREIL